MIARTLFVLNVLILTFGVTLGACARADYDLVWSDEFDGATLDGSNWTPMIGDGTDYGVPGWGNNELQHYTGRAENVHVRDGHLVIVARREAEGTPAYTSARIRSAGKRDFVYGKFEARVKLPSGRGLWPAFWLMPTDDAYGMWAASGEVDILEAVNERPDRVMGSVFFGGKWPKQEHISRFHRPLVAGRAVDLSADFHVYALEWQPYEMRWSMDGYVYSIQHDWNSVGGTYPAPFDQPFHMLLNTAIGGNGPGFAADAIDDGTPWAEPMLVDWVRVYQTDNQPPAVEVTSPADGARLPAEGPLIVAVNATDSDGHIDRVEFRNDGELIGVDRAFPFELSWPVGDGCYRIGVRAIDDGDFARHATIAVTKGVGCPRRPYHGTRATIPGRIEAEDFDLGLPGEAYADYDEINHGNAYRLADQVDVQECGEGGFNLGWMMIDEWLAYSVQVLETGKYDLTLRVSSPAPEGPAKVRIEVDGVDRTGTVVLPVTGDWLRYTDVRVEGITLEAGPRTIRLVVENSGFNLNWMTFAPAGQALINQ